MRAIFRDRAEVVAEYVEDDYQGTEAFAYRFPDGSCVILTDYFGSCSGCDAWEDALDDEVRTMVASLVNSSRIFPSVSAAADFCTSADDDASDYPFRAAVNLTEALAALASA